MLVLLAATFFIYISRLTSTDALQLIQRGLRGKSETFDANATIVPEISESKRVIFGPKPTDLQHEEALVASYADPFKAALSIFKLLGANKFHQMTSSKTQLRYAFVKLRRWSQRPIAEPKRSWWQWRSKTGNKSRDDLAQKRGFRSWWSGRHKAKNAKRVA
uniref:Secreted RxLR effector protein 83 n=1 Tax=Plasmopara viticola TaxID=143451 RepID=RLR83_PLAVT|nr:RecName: Full=Secreted RxLR effector protein 83; Flags: Precursor [Plasmopara viticola]